MLLASFLFVGLAAAARYCYEAREKLPLPSCTDACLATDRSVLDGVCADNLKGLCELDGAVASFFRVYAKCLSQSCPDDTDRESFVKIFQEQCGWASDITDAEARYFGDWQSYLDRPSTTILQLTTFLTVPPSSASKRESTVTQIGGGIAVSSVVPVEPMTSTEPAPSTTSTTLNDQASSSVMDDSSYSTALAASGLSERSSSALSTSSSIVTPAHNPSPSGTALLAPQSPEPVLSTAAIAGIAVGCTCLLATAFTVIFLLLRRRRREEPEKPRSMSPPIPEAAIDDMPHEKAELAGQEVEPQRSPPIGCVELDAGSQVSPVWEPVHISASARRAKVAQNF